MSSRERQVTVAWPGGRARISARAAAWIREHVPEANTPERFACVYMLGTALPLALMGGDVLHPATRAARRARADAAVVEAWDALTHALKEHPTWGSDQGRKLDHAVKLTEGEAAGLTHRQRLVLEAGRKREASRYAQVLESVVDEYRRARPPAGGRRGQSRQMVVLIEAVETLCKRLAVSELRASGIVADLFAELGGHVDAQSLRQSARTARVLAGSRERGL